MKSEIMGDVKPLDFNETTARVNQIVQIADRCKNRTLSPFEAIDVVENLKYLEDAQDWPNILRCCDLFQFLNKQQGHRDLTRRLLELGIRAATIVGDKPKEAELMYHLAEIHHQQGRHEAAHEMFKKSLSMYVNIGDRHGALLSKHFLVLVTRIMDKKLHDEAYALALQVLDEARDLAAEDPNLAPFVAHPLEVLSIFARDKGDLALERKLLEEAIMIHLDSNRDDINIMLGQCYRRMGQLAVREGRFDEADSYYSSSLIYSKKGLNRRVEAMTLRYMGESYVHQGKYTNALESYGASMDIAIDGKFTDEQILLSSCLSRLYLRTGRYYDAFAEVLNMVFLRKSIAKEGRVIWS